MKRSFRSINFALVFRILGWLLMIESVFMLVPVAAALICHEADLSAFAISTAATLLAGVCLTFGIPSHNRDMGKHEGFLLTALVWVVFSLFGMLPFLLIDRSISVSDAFFEAMSGFTTTGCSVLPPVETFSHAINLWRSLMQWIGGMGIILFTLAVIPMLNHSGGMQMFNAEVTGITHEKLRPRVSQTAKGLWGVYFLLTALLIAFLWAGPMDFYDSVCHAFSTISTGGFSTHSQSLAFYGSNYVTIVVMAFMFLGGTSFALIYRALHGSFKPLWRNEVFRTYLAIIGLFYIIFAISIYVRGDDYTWETLTIYPLFQIISTLTSTGLSVCDYDTWGSFVVALLLVLMFSGACAGSTTGGAKIDRMLFLFKNSRNELYRSMHPNAITSVRINDKVVSADIVGKVIAFICIYSLVMVGGGLLLSALGMPLTDSFFTAFSCVSNTGYGSAVNGYESGFNSVPDAGKWVLSLLMLIGRLELFTVLILFTRGFWRK